MDHDYLVRDAVNETISGILSEQRAAARVMGASASFRINIPLTDVLQRVVSRLQGLHDEALVLPTLTDLHHYLPELGMTIVGDGVELEVHLPPIRKAHAR